jgi:nucleolar protein 15
MSNDTKTNKKRKSGDDVVPLAKKVKTATPTTRTTRSAEKPAAAEVSAPLKSALKKKEPKEAQSAVKAKKEKKATIPAAVAELETLIPDTEDSDPAGAALTPAQTDAIFAGFTDSEDEEEEQAIIDADAIDIAKLPAAPKPKSGNAAVATTSDDPESIPGVVYISRVPHGFYEPQMAAYFSQFGPIDAIRLARNRKTGKSQHFAFIQFESASVADIVARTMDKYLLFGHLLQARTIPMDQVKEGLFAKKGGAKGGKVRPRNRIEGGVLKRGTDRETWGKRVGKEEKRRKGKEAKLKELGYEFEMPAVKGVESVPVQGGLVESGEDVKPIEAKDVIVDEVEEKKIEEVVKEKKEKRKAKGGEVAEGVAAPKKKAKKVKA